MCIIKSEGHLLMPDQYQPIENYGVIGDLNTVALVGITGSIDFLCFPDFDSPSVFGALLDKEKGGFFSIAPNYKEYKTKQMYLPDTNVLVTRFLSAEGVTEITDFMPVADMNVGNALIRQVKSVRGKSQHRLICDPGFDYGAAPHHAEILNSSVYFNSVVNDRSLKIKFSGTAPLRIENGVAISGFTLNEGETAIFIFELLQEEKKEVPIREFAEYCLSGTMNYWKNWINRSTYRGRWLDQVNRSALILKLLTSAKYGSIVAAPTFGLPEQIKGVRNWDYRYTWIRDASFTIYSLIKLGYTKEATAFIEWVHHRCEDLGHAGRLGIMYTLSGEKKLDEYILENWEGYKGSYPVRIGNNAYKQLQLDIYGELMDSIYLYDKYADPISYGFWQKISVQIDWLCKNWRQPDKGIWEVRGDNQEFLYSRLMCWVGIDRAIKLQQKRSFPVHPEWIIERDKIFHSIYNQFWNDDLKSFVQSTGSYTVDAAALLMPLMRFISAKDPRWISTMEQIEKQLVSDSLVYRYRTPDGLTGGEGTFSMCSFWYVECLSKSGKIQKARYYFEKMLSYGNHVGLFSEQLGFEGEHLGNFPQAFTHLGLISAALNLNAQLDNERNKTTEF